MLKLSGNALPREIEFRRERKLNNHSLLPMRFCMAASQHFIFKPPFQTLICTSTDQPRSFCCNANLRRATCLSPMSSVSCAPGADTTRACANSTSSVTASSRISASPARIFRVLPGRTRNAEPLLPGSPALFPRRRPPFTAGVFGEQCRRFCSPAAVCASSRRNSGRAQSPRYQSARGRTSGGSPLLRTHVSNAHFCPVLRSVSTAVECTQLSVIRDT